MNARRVALQGLIPGARPISVASHGFLPVRDTIASAGSGRHRATDTRRERLLAEDEALLLMLSAAIAAGCLDR